MLAAVAGCAGEKSGFGDNVLALVGGDPVTVDDFKLAANDKVPDDIKKRNVILSGLVRDRLVFKKAHSEGFKIGIGMESMMQHIYVEWLPGILTSKVFKDIEVSDDELEMRRPTDAVPILTVTMLIARDQDAADKLLTELKGGASFDDVAKKHKDLLGEDVKHDREISLNDDLYAVGVRAALNKLKPGELSPVIRLELGYAVFKVESRKEPDAQWAAARENVREEIKKTKLNEAMDELLVRLYAQSTIVYKETPEGPSVVVDGTTIKSNQFMSTEQSGDPHAPHSGMNAATVKGALKKTVKNYLLAREARRLGLNTDPKVQRIIELETEKLVASSYLNKMSEGLTATPAEVQEYYEKNKDKFTEKAHIRVSRILLNTKKDADAVLKKLKAGGDFAKLAAQYSQDEASAENGGDVGFVDTEQLKDPMRQTVEGLNVGDVSGIIKSDYGLEILMVTESRPQAVMDISEVRDTIAKRVVLTKRSELVEALYDKLNKEYPVRINTKLLESLK
jgi:parvulin-like peptidyl-prolyl isomerase